MSNLRSPPVAERTAPREAAVWALLWAGGLASTLLLDDPRLRYIPHLWAYAAAAAGWLGMSRHAARWPRSWWLGLIAAAVGFRLWSLAIPPAFSEDVFRYVYEGRLGWVLGPAAPFIHAPAVAPQLDLPAGLLDEAWLRINHPELSTIYPPLAQAVFTLAAALGDLFGHHLIALKALLVAADLGAWAALTRALKKLGRPPTLSLLWGACPLVILEIAREGHADSLSALGLSIGIFGFSAARPRLGYIGWALAALGKLNGLVVMPAAVRTTTRGLPWAIGLCTLLALPWLLAGTDAGAGLSAYAQRWRAGDGAFSLLLVAAERLLGGDWARIGEVTVTRHQLARGLTAVAFAVGAAAILWRSAPKVQIPARAGSLLLLLLLLSPTLHPWYVTWVLPFAVAARGFAGRRAVLLLVVLSALLHHPGWLELIEGEWRDLWALRAAVHGPVWMLWVWDLVRAPKSGYPAASADPGHD